MPFNKTTIQDKELSIQIFKDGFSFCTPNARPFFKFENHSIEKGDAFHELLNSYSFLECEKIKAVHFDHRATFVPISLYNPAQKKNYLNYNVSLEEGCSIAEKQTQDDQVKILYPFEEQTETTLQHYFKDISFTHYSQILYDLSTTVINEDNTMVMNLHMQDDEFDLLVFRGKELLLFNTYPYKNEDSFLYFVLAVAEDLSLSSDGFSIVFFGKYARYKKCYDALDYYHQKITFSDQQSSLMFDEKVHPAPYFINLFH
tara:strand:+ start:23805 stop:24578 length:774 start_codon:yes stop_codon:yes gene_type:complete